MVAGCGYEFSGIPPGCAGARLCFARTARRVDAKAVAADSHWWSARPQVGKQDCLEVGRARVDEGSLTSQISLLTEVSAGHWRAEVIVDILEARLRFIEAARQMAPPASAAGPSWLMLGVLTF